MDKTGFRSYLWLFHSLQVVCDWISQNTCWSLISMMISSKLNRTIEGSDILWSKIIVRLTAKQELLVLQLVCVVIGHMGRMLIWKNVLRLLNLLIVFLFIHELWTDWSWRWEQALHLQVTRLGYLLIGEGVVYLFVNLLETTSSSEVLCLTCEVQMSIRALSKYYMLLLFGLILLLKYLRFVWTLHYNWHFYLQLLHERLQTKNDSLLLFNFEL